LSIHLLRKFSKMSDNKTSVLRYKSLYSLKVLTEKCSRRAHNRSRIQYRRSRNYKTICVSTCSGASPHNRCTRMEIHLFVSNSSIDNFENLKRIIFNLFLLRKDANLSRRVFRNLYESINRMSVRYFDLSTIFNKFCERNVLSLRYR